MPHEQLPHALWRRSSYSGEQGACVELAPSGRLVMIRDSKQPDRAVLAFGRGALAALAEQVKAGQLDR